MEQPQPAAAAPWLEREVWLACAGPFAFLPSIHSQVYFYPRGHSDQCRGQNAYLPADVAIPCTVSSVQLGYHADMDDPYALITLQRDQGPAQPAAAPEHQPPTDTRYYVRQLDRQSLNQCPFGVPKACAQSLFPLLSNDNPSQFLPMLDVHGNGHLFQQRLIGGSNTLSTHWKDYFREKKLQLFKDAVVFIRRGNGQLLIGSRRGGGPSIDRVPSLDRAQEMILDIGAAAESAQRDEPFTVRYYPRQGWAFVVPRMKVDEAIERNWQQGMKVRMTIPVDAHELESSRRVAGTPASYDGVVTNVKNDNTWCKLQVDWDGTSTPNSDVNVWQVEPSVKRHITTASPSSSSTAVPSSSTAAASSSTESIVLFGKTITTGVLK